MNSITNSKTIGIDCLSIAFILFGALFLGIFGIALVFSADINTVQLLIWMLLGGVMLGVGCYMLIKLVIQPQNRREACLRAAHPVDAVVISFKPYSVWYSKMQAHRIECADPDGNFYISDDIFCRTAPNITGWTVSVYIGEHGQYYVDADSLRLEMPSGETIPFAKYGRR